MTAGFALQRFMWAEASMLLLKDYAIQLVIMKNPFPCPIPIIVAFTIVYGYVKSILLIKNQL